jgi:CRISPR-associated protein Csb2
MLDISTSTGTLALPLEHRLSAVTVIRFALNSVVLPLVQDALPFAEQMRRALIRNRVGTEHSEVITGKKADGVPLEGHAHAHYLPTDEDGDGRLDRITVYALRGFGSEDVAALGALRAIYRKGNRPEVRLVLAGTGAAEDFAGVGLLFGPSRHWRSVTPFSLPRFATRGAGKPPRPRDMPEEQFKRELRLRGLPKPVSVTAVDEYVPGERLPVRWLEFQTRRFKGETGYGLAGFEVEFVEDIAGPIALGFACHFGLGLFMPVD